MLGQCIRACPMEHWEGKIAKNSFRWVAYHTLFWLDVYLSPGDEDAFVLRDFHERGGDEREPVVTPGLSQEETLLYVAICRQKIIDTLSAESAEVLQGPCGFSARPISRGELHIYNLRHVQHHTGQLSAFLRRIDTGRSDRGFLPWIGTGWRQHSE
jgi:hypothetical protein